MIIKDYKITMIGIQKNQANQVNLGNQGSDKKQ